MLYESELSHNAAEATKNIYCIKGEYAVDHRTVTKKSLNSEANLESCTWRVSGETGISKLSAKASRAAELCPVLLKYSKTFDSLSY